MAKGTDVKFPGKPCEKISGNEGQTIYIQIDVEGDPPPKVEWFKVNHKKIRFLVYSYARYGFLQHIDHHFRASKTLPWNLGSRDGPMVPLDKLLWVLRTSSRKMRAHTNVFLMEKLSTNSAFTLLVRIFML